MEYNPRKIEKKWQEIWEKQTSDGAKDFPARNASLRSRSDAGEAGERSNLMRLRSLSRAKRGISAIRFSQ